MIIEMTGALDVRVALDDNSDLAAVRITPELCNLIGAQFVIGIYPEAMRELAAVLISSADDIDTVLAARRELDAL